MYHIFFIHISVDGQPRVPGCDGAGVAERSYPMSEVRRGGREEIPLVQNKEQRLHFSGAAVKRYPMSKVRRSSCALLEQP